MWKYSTTSGFSHWVFLNLSNYNLHLNLLCPCLLNWGPTSPWFQEESSSACWVPFFLLPFTSNLKGKKWPKKHYAQQKKCNERKKIQLHGRKKKKKASKKECNKEMCVIRWRIKTNQHYIGRLIPQPSWARPFKLKS